MCVKYWIVGGEYTDTAFSELVDGTERVKGPYLERDAAVRAWQRLTSETRHQCLSRYTIAEEIPHQ